MYLLMHKNTPVASINIENDRPFSFIEVFNKEELPLGTYAASPKLQQNLISSWYTSRAIPDGRPGMDKIINKIGLSKSEAFLKTAGISLIDTYWIKEDNNPLTWEEVNFYDNGFESVLAKEFLTGEAKFSPSPDFTTDGLLQKFWVESYGIPHLVKMDIPHGGLQVANEIIASKIAEKLNIPCVKYTHIKMGDTHASICPSFISGPDKDFVTLLQLKHSYLGQNISIIEKIPKDFLMDTLTLDILLGNEDRHEKNLGFIDGKPSLLFDNGSCLNYGNIGDDIELKLPRMKRSLAAEKYKVTGEIPDFSEIIKETYDEFEIPNDKTQIAIKSLKYGTELLNKELELEMEEER